MHSLHALALMHEKRIARLGSRWTRSQRSASSTVWPGSKGTSCRSKRPATPGVPRRILSLAFKPHSVGGESERLVLLPALARLGKILALVRPAALLAGERPPRQSFGDKAHVSQVVQVDPLGIETGSGRRQIRAVHLELVDMRERTLEAGTTAQRPDVLVHHPLEACDFHGGIDLEPRQIGSLGFSFFSNARLCGPRGKCSSAQARSTAESECLVNCVARVTVGAVRSANRFPPSEEMRPARPHVG